MRVEQIGAHYAPRDHEWSPPGMVRIRSRRTVSGRVPDPVMAALSARFAGRPSGTLGCPSGTTDGARLAGSEGWETVEFDEHCPDQSLDCLVLVGTLETADNPLAVLESAYRVLRPGGLLLLAVHDVRDSSRSAFALASNAGARNLFTGESLQSLLFRCGFVCPTVDAAQAWVAVTSLRSADPPITERPLRLSVVMPVYNEGETFRKVMDQLLSKAIPGVEIEVVVVEGNSTDGTRAEVLSYEGRNGVTIVLEDRPRGKGHAVRQGLARARGDVVLIQDADLEYDIDDYDELLEPIRRCEVGFVLGERMSPDLSWGMRRFVGNTALSHVANIGHLLFLSLFNLVYRQKLRDPFTMYKVFRRDCIYGFEFESDRFDFDWELVAKLIRAGYSPVELPVAYHSRSFSEGKKISVFRDPPTWVRACFKFRFSRLYGQTPSGERAKAPADD
jgi:SAM-dependent methyltransferase